MIRTPNIAPRSGVADMFLKTPVDTNTTTNRDYGWIFTECKRLELLGYGIAVGAFAGTSIQGMLAFRTNGMLGSLALHKDRQAAGHTQITDPAPITMTAVGFEAYRVGGEKDFLWEHNAVVDEYSFDPGVRSRHVMLRTLKSSLTTITYYMWAHVRIHSSTQHPRETE